MGKCSLPARPTTPSRIWCMRPTWCGRMLRTRRSSTTLRNSTNASCAGCPPLHGERSPRFAFGLGQADRRLVVPDSCHRSLADRGSEALTAASRSASSWPAPTRGSAGGAGKTLTVRRCGQSPSGRKSIRSNGWSIRRLLRTRHSFLYSPQGRPCGRRPPAALRPGNDELLVFFECEATLSLDESRAGFLGS
jgi:hypothetical protein